MRQRLEPTAGFCLNRRGCRHYFPRIFQKEALKTNCVPDGLPRRQLSIAGTESRVTGYAPKVAKSGLHVQASSPEPVDNFMLSVGWEFQCMHFAVLQRRVWDHLAFIYTAKKHSNEAFFRLLWYYSRSCALIGWLWC